MTNVTVPRDVAASADPEPDPIIAEIRECASLAAELAAAARDPQARPLLVGAGLRDLAARLSKAATTLERL